MDRFLLAIFTSRLVDCLATFTRRQIARRQALTHPAFPTRVEASRSHTVGKSVQKIDAERRSRRELDALNLPVRRRGDPATADSPAATSLGAPLQREALRRHG